ncbi:hypothetical protein BHE74_00045586 [Ensete ventricosum]|nr:hypothetical protein GW17_00059521 [Ensete ventricosum]RWW48344.1 hypothetical protein BHE74_00045586 [Ensete ventricosum]RZR78014.1 hypothetical protein BHM03_00003235 [Ensete ventricosum]
MLSRLTAQVESGILFEGWRDCCAAHEASTATDEVWATVFGSACRGATEQARNLVSQKVCAHAEEQRSPNDRRRCSNNSPSSLIYF